MKLTQDDYNKLQEGGVDAFNFFLERFQRETLEHAFRLLPRVMKDLMLQLQSLQEMSKKFFDANKDLADKPEIVLKAFQKAEAANPGMSFDDLIIEASREAREILRKNPMEGDRLGRKNLNEMIKNL